MRYSVVALLALVVAGGCAAPATQANQKPPACGPEIPVRSVQVVDAVDVYADEGSAAAIRFAEDKLGPITLAADELVGVYKFRTFKRGAAGIGCDVVIWVENRPFAPGDSELMASKPRYYVILGRTES